MKSASMWPRSERWRLPVAWPGPAAVLALAVAAFATSAPPVSPGATAPVQAGRTAPARPALPPSELDFLRVNATIGDLESGQVLVVQLLDQYDRAGDVNDLFEAVQWIDRHWPAGSFQQSGLATRVFERYCGHKVLRWHWLCDTGE